MAISRADLMGDWMKAYGFLEVTPKDFYTSIFRKCLQGQSVKDNSETRGSVIIQTVVKPKSAGKGKLTILDENLDGLEKAIESANRIYEHFGKEGQLGEVSVLTFTNGCTYLGKRMVANNLFELSALIVEVDDLIGNDDPNQEGLRSLMKSFTGGFAYDEDSSGGLRIPKPTYLVCSGSGIHLYYVFEKPIRVNRKSFYKQYEALDDYKYCLMYTLWKRLRITDKELEKQGIAQRYRLVGTRTKEGGICRAFQVGQTVSIAYMNQFCEDLSFEDEHSGRLMKAPEIYEIEYTAPKEKQQEEKKETIPRLGNLGKGAYVNVLNVIKNHAKEGKRYWMVFCLASVARNCAIPYEQLEKDAYGLLDYLDSLTEHAGENQFTKSDIECALKSYYYTGSFMRKSTCEQLCGVKFAPAIKRNGRTRKEHLEYMKEQKELKRKKGEPVDSGRSLKWWPVLAYRLLYLDGTKAECEKKAGVSRHTILKYWTLADELEECGSGAVNGLSEALKGHSLDELLQEDKKPVGVALVKEQAEKILMEKGLLGKYTKTLPEK